MWLPCKSETFVFEKLSVGHVIYEKTEIALTFIKEINNKTINGNKINE